MRPLALAPQVRSTRTNQLLMPIDPVSDGTWIAASDAGLIAVLMNVYPATSDRPSAAVRPSQFSRISRGRIIPQLVEATSLGEAISLANSMDHSRFEPFRLIICDHTRYAQCKWSENQFVLTAPESIDEPIFFTSSGLGDEFVATPRQRLFDSLFVDSRDWVASQDAFHRHVWHDNHQASVWMTRPEARTVSRTEIELGSQRVKMTYHARLGDSDELETATAMSLSILQSPSAQIVGKAPRQAMP